MDADQGFRSAPVKSGLGELPTRPIQGIKVLDRTNILTGPVAAMMLADQGAEVVKVDVRPQGPPAIEFRVPADAAQPPP